MTALEVPELVSDRPLGRVAVTVLPLPLFCTRAPEAVLPVLFTSVRPVAVPAVSSDVWFVTVNPLPDALPLEELPLAAAAKVKVVVLPLVTAERVRSEAAPDRLRV